MSIVVKTSACTPRLVGSFRTYEAAFDALRLTGWSMRHDPESRKYVFSCHQGANTLVREYDRLQAACELYQGYTFYTEASLPEVVDDNEVIVVGLPHQKCRAYASWEAFFSTEGRSFRLSPPGVEVQIGGKTFRGSSLEDVATSMLPTLEGSFLVVPRPSYQRQGWVTVVAKGDNLVGAYASVDDFLKSKAATASGLLSIEGLGTETVKAVFPGLDGPELFTRGSGVDIFVGCFEPRGWLWANVGVARRT